MRFGEDYKEGKCASLFRGRGYVQNIVKNEEPEGAEAIGREGCVDKQAVLF